MKRLNFRIVAMLKDSIRLSALTLNHMDLRTASLCSEVDHELMSSAVSDGFGRFAPQASIAVADVKGRHLLKVIPGIPMLYTDGPEGWSKVDGPYGRPFGVVLSDVMVGDVNLKGWIGIFEKEGYCGWAGPVLILARPMSSFGLRILLEKLKLDPFTHTPEEISARLLDYNQSQKAQPQVRIRRNLSH